MLIHNLPSHIFFVIRDFVFLPDSYQNHERCDGEQFLNASLFAATPLRPEFKIASPLYWRNFVNANKKDFSEIKRLTVYYDLQSSVSSRLLGMTAPSNSLFAQTAPTPVQIERIKTLAVRNINQQVNFGFAFKVRALPALFSVSAQTQGTVEIPFPFEKLTIELQEMGNSGGLFGGGGGLFANANNGNSNEIFEISLRNFPFVKYLTIWSKNSTDTTSARMLKIYTSSSMQLHSFVTNIKCEFVDQNEAQFFQHLTLSQMPLLTSLPDTLGLVLGSLHRVDLSHSKKLVDVSSLRRVHTLNLKGCELLEDVSMLGDVYSLNINDCPRILSINALGKVKKLSIKGLKELRDGLPADSEVKELWVDTEGYVRAGVPNFKDHDKRINIFSAVRGGLFGPSGPPPPYSHIPFVKIYISSLDLRGNCDLTGIRELVMEQCKLPSQFTPTLFPELRRLLLLRCDGVERIAFDRLPNLKMLKIDGCNELKNVCIEHEMEQLELFSRAEVVHLTIRAAVKVLILRSCSALKLLDIMAPIGVYEVSGLKNCRVYHRKGF